MTQEDFEEFKKLAEEDEDNVPMPFVLGPKMQAEIDRFVKSEEFKEKFYDIITGWTKDGKPVNPILTTEN